MTDGLSAQRKSATAGNAVITDRAASAEDACVSLVIADVSARYPAKNDVNPAGCRSLNLLVIKLSSYNAKISTVCRPMLSRVIQHGSGCSSFISTN